MARERSPFITVTDQQCLIKLAKNSRMDTDPTYMRDVISVVSRISNHALSRVAPDVNMFAWSQDAAMIVWATDSVDFAAWAVEVGEQCDVPIFVTGQ